LNDVGERDDDLAARKRFRRVHGLVEFVGSACERQLPRMKIDDGAEIGARVQWKRETGLDDIGASIVPSELHPAKIERLDEQSDDHRLDDCAFAVQPALGFGDDLLRRPVLPSGTCDARQLEHVREPYDTDAVRRCVQTYDEEYVYRSPQATDPGRRAAALRRASGSWTPAHPADTSNPGMPVDSPFLDSMERVRRRGAMRWRDPGGEYFYEWDDLHGEVEVYDRRGNHRGVADPVSGEIIKPAIKGRRIDV
jgi:hypothetical protein